LSTLGANFNKFIAAFLSISPCRAFYDLMTLGGLITLEGYLCVCIEFPARGTQIKQTPTHTQYILEAKESTTKVDAKVTSN
jgi:hypothetical protein